MKSAKNSLCDGLGVHSARGMGDLHMVNGKWTAFI